MHAPIIIPASASRSDAYAALAPQVKAVLHQERDPIAAMANLTAMLRQSFHWHWIGFYRVIGDELVLGPFQGPVACTRIGFGKGVCGTAWKEGRSVVVDDVETFPGHIACSALSRSEVVVPVFDPNGRVVAVLDVDSDRPADFGPIDAKALEELCAMLQPLF